MYTFLLSSFTVFIYFSQHTHDTTQCESGFKSRFTVNIKEKLPKPPRHYPLGGGVCLKHRAINRASPKGEVFTVFF